MPDLVTSMLRMSYLYARLIGVMNFEVNLKTARPRITTTTTIYAAVVNVLFFSVVPIKILTNSTVHAIWTRSNLLHEYVFVMVAAIRLIGVVLTIISRWYKRQKIMQFVKALRHLYIQKPQVKRLYRRGVISKTICGVVSECLQLAVGLDALKSNLTFEVALSVTLLYIVTALLNLIITQYYFAMLNIHGHFILLNHELEGIIAEAKSLSLIKRPPRNRGMGVFVTKCCDLADRVDQIAQTESELHNIFTLMSKIFGIQGLCVASTYYLTTASTIYFTFSTFKYGIEGMGFSIWGLVMICVSTVFHYADGCLTTYILFYVMDAHAKMSSILEERTILSPCLDERFDTALESLQFQLAKNKLRIRVLNLFDIGRNGMLSMGNSLIINTLLLIQYDIANYPS